MNTHSSTFKESQPARVGLVCDTELARHDGVQTYVRTIGRWLSAAQWAVIVTILWLELPFRIAVNSLKKM